MLARSVPSRSLAVPLLAAALVAVPAAEVIGAEDTPSRRTIALVGEGEVKAAPDLATVSLGVVRQAETARAALTANNQAMRGILDALKAEGIAEKDIETSNFSVSPRYVYPQKGTEQPPRIVGYEVSNQATILVRELAKLGGVLDRVVSLGSNQIAGIAFSIADPRPLRDEARRLATRDALRKARLYAEEAGVKLGPIVSIDERDRSAPPPRPVFKRMAAEPAMAEAAVPVAQGEQSILVQVNIAWEIQ